MKAHEIAERILGQTARGLDCEVRIVVQSQGSVGGTPSVAVSRVEAGFDWDNNKFLIYPKQALTTLEQDDIAAIHESVRKGGSWHAYQQYKKQAERIKALEAELAAHRAAHAAAHEIGRTLQAAKATGCADSGDGSQKDKP